LFGMFSAAFLLLGLTRFLVALSHNLGEGQTHLYWLRLVAYLAILAAIVDKNRR
jgi:hypothetical protein